MDRITKKIANAMKSMGKIEYLIDLKGQMKNEGGLSEDDLNTMDQEIESIVIGSIEELEKIKNILSAISPKT